MSFNQNLQREISHWVKDGLISPQTAEILRQRYPVIKRSMTQTLALLGIILLGVGVILFFAANWQFMPRSLKVVIVVLSFTISYSVGYYLRCYKRNYPKIGYALICLGSLLYGSSIWLIAQIFHIQAESGLGFLLWYLGVIPVAYLFSSSFNLFLAQVNLTAWFLAGMYPLGWVYLIFPLLLGITIYPLSIRKKDIFNFSLATLAVYAWFTYLSIKLVHDNANLMLIFAGLLLFSLIIYFLAQHFRHKPFFAGYFLLVFSLLGLFIGFAPFTIHSFLQRIAHTSTFYDFPYLLWGTLLIIIFIKMKQRNLGLYDLPLVLILPCFMLYSPLLGENTFILVLNNLLLFIFTLLAIYYGYLLKRPIIFNMSIMLFAAAVVLKYFDIFFALLPRSMFFMTGGTLLILGSFMLEYKRRNLLKSMERGE